MILFPEGPFSKPTNLLTVKFIDEKFGWVAGADGVARTTAGGKTWQVKTIEGTPIGGIYAHSQKTESIERMIRR